jgi:hypothetical protein
VKEYPTNFTQKGNTFVLIIFVNCKYQYFGCSGSKLCFCAKFSKKILLFKGSSQWSACINCSSQSIRKKTLKINIKKYKMQYSMLSIWVLLLALANAFLCKANTKALASETTNTQFPNIEYGVTIIFLKKNNNKIKHLLL